MTGVSSWRVGLRTRFNAVLVPVTATALVGLLWLDSRHEAGSVMEAHAIHEVRGDETRPGGPVDAATTPAAAVREAVRLHAVVGAGTLVVLVLVINTVLTRLVLTPLARARSTVGLIQQRFRAGVPSPTGSHEVDELVQAFEVMGMTLDVALVQAFNADRLAVVALLSKTLAAEVEPALQELASSAAALQTSSDEAARGMGQDVAKATARILASIHRLDQPFTTRG